MHIEVPVVLIPSMLWGKKTNKLWFQWFWKGNIKFSFGENPGKNKVPLIIPSSFLILWLYDQVSNLQLMQEINLFSLAKVSPLHSLILGYYLLFQNYLQYWKTGMKISHLLTFLLIKWNSLVIVWLPKKFCSLKVNPAKIITETLWFVSSLKCNSFYHKYWELAVEIYFLLNY